MSMIHAVDIIFHPCEIYREGTCNRRYSVVCELLKTKMVKEPPIHQDGLKMIGFIEQLESLNNPLDHNLAIDIFLAPLSESLS